MGWLLLLWSTDSGVQAPQLWHTGFIVLWHVGLRRSGSEPVSPALAGEFFTTELPGNSLWDLDVVKLLSKKNLGFLNIEENKIYSSNVQMIPVEYLQK